MTDDTAASDAPDASTGDGDPGTGSADGSPSDGSSGTLGDYRSTLDYATPDFLSRWSDSSDDAREEPSPVLSFDDADSSSSPDVPPLSTWSAFNDEPVDEPVGESAERSELLEQVRDGAQALLVRKQEEAGIATAGRGSAKEAARGWRPDDGSDDARAAKEAKAAKADRAAKAADDATTRLAVRQATTGIRTMGFIAVAIAIGAALFDATGIMWTGSIVAVLTGLILIFTKWLRATAVVMIALAIAPLVFHAVNGGVDGLPGGSGGIAAGGVMLGSTSLPSYSGSGDETVAIALPDGPNTVAVLDITTEDRYTSVTEVLADKNTYYMGAVWDAGTHSLVINTRAEPTVALEIESDEAWTVSIRSVSTLPILSDAIAGDGSSLVRYDGPGGLAEFTFDGESSIEIETHGAAYWTFRADDVRTMTRDIPPGPYVIDIDIDGPWQISVGPSPTPGA